MTLFNENRYTVSKIKGEEKMLRLPYNIVVICTLFMKKMKKRDKFFIIRENVCMREREDEKIQVHIYFIKMFLAKNSCFKYLLYAIVLT